MQFVYPKTILKFVRILQAIMIQIYFDIQFFNYSCEMKRRHKCLASLSKSFLWFTIKQSIRKISSCSCQSIKNNIPQPSKIYQPANHAQIFPNAKNIQDKIIHPITWSKKVQRQTGGNGNLTVKFCYLIDQKLAVKQGLISFEIECF